MKSEIVNGQNMGSVKPFPKLMVSTDKGGNPGQIVLFSTEGAGTCLAVGTTRYYQVGEYYDGFSMGCFKDFDGVIQLSND